MTRPKLTTQQAVFLAEKVENLFERAAAAWVNGNNSGNPAALTRGEKRCEELREQAEALLAPLKIVVDYPGLYPSFTVRGFAEHSTLAAISAALERKSTIKKGKVSV